MQTSTAVRDRITRISQRVTFAFAGPTPYCMPLLHQFVNTTGGEPKGMASVIGGKATAISNIIHSRVVRILRQQESLRCGNRGGYC